MTQTKVEFGKSPKPLKGSPCPLCETLMPRLLFLRKGESIMRCGSCGLIYNEGRSPVEAQQSFYEQSYYELLREKIKEINQARIPLYQEALWESARFRKTGRLLDIGSGYGDFLKMAQEYGWEAWGIEPSLAACEAAKKIEGVHTFNGTVKEADFPKEHFDVITFWNVVDCLPDPVSVMKQVREWLVPGGMVIVRTPNVSFHLWMHKFYSAFRPLCEALGWKNEASVFLRSNFSTESLNRLFAQSGFDGITIVNARPSEGDAYRIFSLSFLMGWAKSLVFGLAKGISRLTVNRMILGPSLYGVAIKCGLEQAGRDLGMERRILFKRRTLQILAVCGYVFLLPLWRKLFKKNREIRILLYHSVDSKGAGDMTVRIDNFERQLDFLNRTYQVIPLKEAISYLERDRAPDIPSVSLTFDDGYSDNYQVVLPVLLRRRIKAAFFLLTTGDGYDRRATHLKEDALGGNQLLGWSEVRDMAALGMELGSHGKSHAPLGDLSVDDLENEMVDSKQRIEQEIGRGVEYFSYPYGTLLDFDKRTKFYVRQAGYQAAFSKIYGTNAAGADLFAIKRIGVEASDTLFTLRAKLNGALDLLILFDLPWVRKAVRRVNHWVLSGKQKISKDAPILLVSVDFPPHTDGVSTISRELSTRIANAGQSVVIIGPRDQGAREFDAAQRYRAFRVPGYEWGQARFLPIFLCMPWVVLRYGVRKIFAMNIAYGGVIAWLLSWIKPLEYILFAYGYEFEKVKNNPLARWFYLRIYARAQEIICCSQLVKDRLIEFGVRDKEIKVLYPAVDLARYRPCAVPHEFLNRNQLAGRRILLAVGRLVERKGHDQVFRALPKIIQNFPDILYCVVGIGQQESRLREEVRRLHLEEHVRFMGKISEDDLVRIYNACEIFIMPSREITTGGHVEGFGIVYLEANACKKPVLGGNSGGIKEAVQDGVTGLLVNPESPEEICEKIMYLLAHPEESRRLGEQGFAWVQQNFSWDHYAREAFRLLTGKELVPFSI